MFDEADYPRAFCHIDEVEAKIMAWEMKHSTPMNEEEIAQAHMEVHADHEDCDCDCCAAA